MKKIIPWLVNCLLCLCLISAAEEKPADKKDPETKKDEKKEAIEEKTSVTNGEVLIRGSKVAYTATAGTLLLKKEDGKERASIFYIAYTSGDKAGHGKRPITFSFNGGPGSSSVWMHLGLLGPKRVKLDKFGRQPPPPYKLVENNFSLLDKTDLVFIDPVSTGYSRAADEKEAGQFHGIDGDVESVGEFIRLYLTRNERWDSPKFLIGESYGTTRATALAHHLQQKRRIYLNGIMLVSSVLQFQTLRFNGGNDLPYIVFLPSYTASAWYHKKLPADLQKKPLREVLKLAEDYAVNSYPGALLSGRTLTQKQKQEHARQLSRLTGLGEDYIIKSHLRVSSSRFFKELLRDEGRTTGRFDSRFTGLDRNDLGTSPDYDPSATDIMGVFTATLHAYLREELGFESDLPYEILSSRVHPWDYGSFQNRYVDTSERLRHVMTTNPALKVHVSSGFYDLATPYFATEYTFNTLALHPSLEKNLTIDYYEGGHMMYLIPGQLAKQSKDLAHFFDSALEQ